MKIADFIEPLNCKVIHQGRNFEEIEIRHVVASDLMSDVLVVDKDQLMLVTSLPSDQVIRTADIVGIHVILVVNHKTLPESMISLAKEMDITLIQSPLPKFETCVKLGRLMNLS